MTTEIHPDGGPAPALAESLPHMIFEAAADGRPVYCNRRWYDYAGLTPRSGSDEGWLDRLHPEDRERRGRAWDASLRDGVPFEAECRLRGGDGRHRWFLVRAVPHRDDSGAIASWLATCTDVDDLMRSLEAVRRSNEELERFAAIAAHDLQEPLRKLRSFSERLAARAGPGMDDRGRDYVARIVSAADRMWGLIQDVLGLARVEVRELHFDDVDLREVVDAILEDVDLGGGSVQVGDLPTIRADSGQMRRLLQNLIANALKFHRPGVPPTVRISAREAAGEGGGPPRCVLEVADDGVGFDEAHLGRIFQPFQRLNGRSEFDGAGLGLAICRKIVERHAGSITAESSPGVGSVFRVSLPLSPPAPGAPEA